MLIICCTVSVLCLFFLGVEYVFNSVLVNVYVVCRALAFLGFSWGEKRRSVYVCARSLVVLVWFVSVFSL